VLAEAEDLNQPLLWKMVDAAKEVSWSALGVEGMSLGLSGFKPAEEAGALILRAYEPAGARGTAKLSLPPGWEIAGEVNLLEEAAGPANLGFTPFQLHSWRIKPRG
jgi:alpha-mannosidase